MLCARECPDWCIYIDSHKETLPAPEGGRPRQRNVLDRFAIDFSLCMYCGICIEVCPFDALFWSPEFEYAEGDIRNLLHEKDRLATWVPTVPPPPAHDPGAEPPKELAAAPRRPAAGPRAAGAPAGARASGAPSGPRASGAAAAPRTGDAPTAARSEGTTSATPEADTSSEAPVTGTSSEAPVTDTSPEARATGTSSEARATGAPSPARAVDEPGGPTRESARRPAAAGDSGASERPSTPGTAEPRVTRTTKDVSAADVPTAGAPTGDVSTEDTPTAETRAPSPSQGTPKRESRSADPAQAMPTPESRHAHGLAGTEGSTGGAVAGPDSPGQSPQTEEPGQPTRADDKPGRTSASPQRPARAAGRTRMTNIRGIRPPGALPAPAASADKPAASPTTEGQPSESLKGDTSPATAPKSQGSETGHEQPLDRESAQIGEDRSSAGAAQGAQGEGDVSPEAPQKPPGEAEALEPSSTGPTSGEELSTASGEPQPNPEPEEQTSGPRPRRRRMADPRSIRPPGRLDPDDPREPEEE
ncbi:4Fe-4S binding protein [Nonomuraea montanisoli]|uniref:4Fe-4S binding protein n=1 Tax=Nonomuraea montanisoli TaxID=2741721 RepID=UPI001F40AA48